MDGPLRGVKLRCYDSGVRRDGTGTAARIAITTAACVVGCGDASGDESPRAPAPADESASGATAGSTPDPANIAGRWDYRTESNCGGTEGVGELRFDWQPERDRYGERGCVHWPDSDNTIWWWGNPRYDAGDRRLVGINRNSLGDTVDGTWRLKGPGPERLVVTWKQSNGCEGRGIATRGRAGTGPGRGLRLPVLAGTLDPNESDSPCDARRAGPDMWPDDAE